MAEANSTRIVSITQGETSVVEYRDVPNWPGYRVGTDGTVWSCWKRAGGSGGYAQSDEWHQLGGGLDKDGCRKLILCANGKRWYVRANVLVLTVFVGPRPHPKMTAAHNNGIRTDNRLSNLRWATQKENVADKRLHGTHQAGEKSANHKVTAAQVLEIRRRWAGGETQTSIASHFHIAICTASAICTGRNWKDVKPTATDMPLVQASLFDAVEDADATP